MSAGKVCINCLTSLAAPHISVTGYENALSTDFWMTNEIQGVGELANMKSVNDEDGVYMPNVYWYSRTLIFLKKNSYLIIKDRLINSFAH